MGERILAERTPIALTGISEFKFHLGTDENLNSVFAVAAII